MAEQREHIPWRWGRWFKFGLALVLLAAAGFFAWWSMTEPRRAARRPFVGTWRLESPVFPANPGLAVEVDLLSNGTIRDRVWNPQTGVVLHEELRPGRWSIADGRLREVIGGSVLDRWLGRKQRLGWDHRVTWEGRDRLRLEATMPRQATMVWVRCERPPDR